MTKPIQKRTQRAPTGTSANPIYLRFKPEEYERITQIADHEQRSLASLCRVSVLSALADYQIKPPQETQQTAANPPASAA